MTKAFIIAEAGVNHNGNINIAKRLIDAAVQAGSDAVKFQAFIADKLVSKGAKKADYQIKNMSKSEEAQYEMLKKLEFSNKDFRELKDYCDSNDIEFMTTPFDEDSADSVVDLLKRIKIPSGEITNLPFVKYLAQKGKPLILSTGMSTLGEVEKAVNILAENQNIDEGDIPTLTVLHCTTNYPCPYEEVNLNAMLTLKNAFNLPVGYSDHTLGIEVPIAAAAMGATVVEKHFTLDRSMEGPDHKASLEPDELKRMVQSIRNIEIAIGDGRKRPNQSELKIMNDVRKSIIAKEEISSGTKITSNMIEIKRPGNGLPPDDMEKIIGLRIYKDKKAEDVLTWEDFKYE
ncbi:MAG: N-acetylneuraminate synthase [Candidatus Marinimicrobia bacterium]|nr:N-acetylneuraminate synthase [Candidatus Neomarinimicrobiota bacterium]MCF7828755.1 N-acetylneuraminate synthase [Candidatus Neomarinimicrobiota bacterium]MCF7880672.1 N-acetylneuraminate synthase [Candidatus Neomarinimicrobiota bacterium]